MTIDDILREEFATPPDQLPDYESDQAYLQAGTSDVAGLFVESDTAGPAAQLRPYQWKPGQSGNPAGRPRKGQSYRELAEARPSHRKLAIVLAQEQRAIAKGDTRAAEWLRDTAEGKPATRIVVEQADGPSPFIDALRAIRQEIAEARGVIEGEARVVDRPQEAEQE